MKKKENPPKGKGLEAGKPRAAARPKKGNRPDPVGMRFETSRYPHGAWLKVSPDGYCSEAYNAKYYGLVELPDPDGLPHRNSNVTPRRAG